MNLIKSKVVSLRNSFILSSTKAQPLEAQNSILPQLKVVKSSSKGSSIATTRSPSPTTSRYHDSRSFSSCSGLDQIGCHQPGKLVEPDLPELFQTNCRVKPWEVGVFTMVKKLQDARRNQGCVDQMQCRTGVNVAVKRMPNSWMQDNPDQFSRVHPNSSEQPWVDVALVQHLNDVSFPFACTSLGIFRDLTTTYVVTSLATEGDLFNWCGLAPQPGPEREKIMRSFVRQIFSAVKLLHEYGIAHRDLSLENILLTDSGSGPMQIKLIDFGMATLSRISRGEIRGKKSYQAPEMHTGKPYDTFLSDTFALGVVLFAMAATDYPWNETHPDRCQLFAYVSSFGLQKFMAKRKLRKGKGEYIMEVFSPELVQVMTTLLELDPEKRTSLGESNFADVGGKSRFSVWEMAWLYEC